MSGIARGLLDTSVFIANESGRSLRTELLPDESLVCVITVAELYAGVLAAADTDSRARRLTTVGVVGALRALPVDAAAARHWATLRVRLAEEGRRAKINDLWIAAVAVAHDLPVVTQDSDFDVIEQVGGPIVIHV